MTLQQRTPLARKTALKAKPMKAKEPRPRKCENVDCRVWFKPQRMGQRACCVPCSIVVGRMDKAKAELTAHKAVKAASRKLQVFLKEAEEVVNEYVRERDRYQGCISCFKGSHWDGIWTASHFKSVGSNSVLRYNLLNIHKGCTECNLFKSGNLVEYERRLRLKLGDERVEWLKCQTGVRKYTREYLVRLKQIMKKKTKRLKKRRGE